MGFRQRLHNKAESAVGWREHSSGGTGEKPSYSLAPAGVIVSFEHLPAATQVWWGS